MSVSDELVSVIVCVAGGPDYVTEAIQSVLRQSYRPLELIIIDDGADKECRTLLEELAAADARIKLAHNGENIGLTRSLIHGLRLASGSYIARQDSDDVSLPERIEQQATFLNCHPNIALVGTGAALIGSTGRQLRIEHVVESHQSIVSGLRDENQFIHGSVMFRRSAYNSVGGYRAEYRYAQDYDLFLRLSERYAVANIDKPLYKLRMHDRRISSARAEDQLKFALIARLAASERRASCGSPSTTAEPEDLQRFAAAASAPCYVRELKTKQRLNEGREFLLAGCFHDARRSFFNAFRLSPSARTGWHLLRALFSGPLFKR